MSIISSEFAKEREKVESRRTYLKMRRQNQMDNELHAYIDWICKAGESIHFPISIATNINRIKL